MVWCQMAGTAEQVTRPGRENGGGVALVSKEQCMVCRLPSRQVTTDTWW